MRVIILGSAAGGGLPQWNCGCRNCQEARLSGTGRTQSSVAVSADGDGRLRATGAPEPRLLAVATAAVPLRQPATCRRAEDDDAHSSRKVKRPGSPPGPSFICPNLVQAVPAYAPTSIPSSTTSNSGFVHFM